jgi:hypothetical protein
MRYVISILFVIAAFSSSKAATPMTIELATGFAADHFPTQRGWKYDVSPDNLYYREYAGRFSLGISKRFAAHLAVDWIDNRSVQRDITLRITDEIPPLGYKYDHGLNQKILTSSFGMSLNSEDIRLSLGLIYYKNLNGVTNGDEYFLNKPHGFSPIFALELGNPLYVFGSFMNSLPLYSSGILSFGLGVKYPLGFDHKVFIDLKPGIGYRGEYPVYRNFSISLGFFYNEIGHKNVISCILGVKSGFLL